MLRMICECSQYISLNEEFWLLFHTKDISFVFLWSAHICKRILPTVVVLILIFSLKQRQKDEVIADTSIKAFETVIYSITSREIFSVPDSYIVVPLS